MSPWEPGPRLLGNLYIIILGTLTTFTWKTWEPCREPWRNLEGTFWEPFGNLEGTLRNLGNLGNLEGTLREPWEPLLGNLGTFTWEPGNLYLGTWEPLLGNLLLGNLGTFTWEPLLGNLYLGTFTWEPWLGTWEPWGNGFWSCSGLLRNLYYGWRPQSILLLGKKLFLASSWRAACSPFLGTAATSSGPWSCKAVAKDCRETLGKLDETRKSQTLGANWCSIPLCSATWE